MVELTHALDFSPKSLAQGMNHCFEDYVIPMEISEQALAGMLRMYSVDLLNSILAIDQGEIVGVLLLGRRGDVSRVGAMAVAKAHRGQGLGHRILEKAIEDSEARGESKMVLEAIEHNTRAISFYESLGFEWVCRICGYSKVLDQTGKPNALEQISFGDMATILQSRGDDGLTWEMNHATVAQLALPSFAVSSNGMSAAISPMGDDALLCRSLAITGEQDDAKLIGLLAGLADEYPGRTLKIPVYFPEPIFGGLFNSVGFETSSLAQVMLERFAADH